MNIKLSKFYNSLKNFTKKALKLVEINSELPKYYGIKISESNDENSFWDFEKKEHHSPLGYFNIINGIDNKLKKIDSYKKIMEILEENNYFLRIEEKKISKIINLKKYKKTRKDELSNIPFYLLKLYLYFFKTNIFYKKKFDEIYKKIENTLNSNLANYNVFIPILFFDVEGDPDRIFENKYITIEKINKNKLKSIIIRNENRKFIDYNYIPQRNFKYCKYWIKLKGNSIPNIGINIVKGLMLDLSNKKRNDNDFKYIYPGENIINLLRISMNNKEISFPCVINEPNNVFLDFGTIKDPFSLLISPYKYYPDKYRFDFNEPNIKKYPYDNIDNFTKLLEKYYDLEGNTKILILNRLQNAYFKEYSYEKIIDLSIIFESLLVGRNESIKSNIKDRVPIILKHLHSKDIEKENIEKIMKNFYKLRCAIVHGDSLDDVNGEKEKLVKLIGDDNIGNYFISIAEDIIEAYFLFNDYFKDKKRIDDLGRNN